MYALRKTRRKRIDEGRDWLTIKSLPASRDAMPWYWNCADPRYTAWPLFLPVRPAHHSASGRALLAVPCFALRFTAHRLLPALAGGDIDDVCKTLRISRSTFYRYVRL